MRKYNLKNKIAISTITLLAVSSIVGCGNKNNGPTIVTAGDSGVKNESLYNGESTEEDLYVNTSDVGGTEEGEQSTKKKNTSGKMDSIVGVWTTEFGDIYQFDKDGSYAGYSVESGENSYGTYETDNKTKLTIKNTIYGAISAGISEEIGDAVSEASENVTEDITEYEIVSLKDNTLELKTADGTSLILTLAVDDEVSEEDEEVVIEDEPEELEEDMTTEEIAEIEQMLIDQGINPETGFTFEEEAAMAAEAAAQQAAEGQAQANAEAAEQAAEAAAQ